MIMQNLVISIRKSEVANKTGGGCPDKRNIALIEIIRQIFCSIHGQTNTNDQGKPIENGQRRSGGEASKDKLALDRWIQFLQEIK